MEPSISLHGRKFKPFILNADIEKAIDAVAIRLNADYAHVQEADAPVLFCTLNGAVLFMAELLKRIQFPCVVKAAKLSSYEGTRSTGVVKAETPLSGMEGKEVIVVEDIVDTGNTIQAVIDLLQAAGASRVRICTLLLKPEVYKKAIPLDYVAMEIPNRFIVGFGLDYDELGRNNKDIYVLDE